MLKAREVIHVPDTARMPPEAVRAQTVLRAQGIRSVLAIPMICESAVTGFVGFDAVRSHKTWQKRDIALLRIAGEIFAGALERARADRERQRLHTQLVQSRSLESVARLAGGIAHEFNNLLAVILNYATLLKRQIEKPSQREMVGELFETARRAAELTRQLLLVGRRDVAEPMLLDLSSVVRSLEPLLEKTVGDAIDLRLEIGEDLDIVRIGLPQVEQIILNLALNARDAMPGGGALTIRTENVDITPEHASRFIDVRPGRCVRLRVTDSGTGMSSEVAARAFEPFFTTKGPEGVGLGLATVHGIVKQAGGHVVLTAPEGAGTTVDVYLPAIVAVADEAPVSAAEASAPPGGSLTGRGETVLVVDDSPALRRLVCTLLAASRYRVFEGGTVEDAIAVCEKLRDRLDLLLTDVRMPSVSGRDLAARLRAEYGVSRVLYMSGYDADIVTHQGVLPEGMRLIQKPFTEDVLLRAVRDALDARQDPEQNKGSVTA
jgi:signal transduction histidine kinase/CheY-like chemotaxis protein